jgi:hypothetical protein
MTRENRSAVREQPATRAGLIGSGGLLLGGLLLYQLATMFHPGHETPNDHPAVFAEYASSRAWVAVHFAQFFSALIVLAGFLALHQAIARSEDQLLRALSFAAAAATAAAIAVNMAVDGVALKQAVHAWASAPQPDKATRFATAETVRWLEWGANSFFQVLLGVTAGLTGLLLVRSRTAPRWIGLAGLLTGTCLVAAGITVASDGFADSPVGLVASVLFLGMVLGILLEGIRSRKRDSTTQPATQPIP